MGYAALRGCESSYATVAEIFAAPGDRDVFDALLRSAIILSLDGCAETLRTLAVPGSWPYRGFRRAGFLRAGTGTIQYIPLDPGLMPSAVGAPGDWQFAAGDFDAV